MGTAPLPYEQAEGMANLLVIAARDLSDGGARLGELAGTVSLDRRLAGTVLGILATAVAAAEQGS